MYRIIALLAMSLTVLLLAACTTTVENRTASVDEGLTVRGVGKVQASPDIAFLTIGVVARGPDVTSVRSQAADAMTRVIAALKDGGVSQDDIQTSYFVVRSASVLSSPSCDSGPNFTPSGGPVPTSICVSNEVDVKIRKVDQAGQIVDRAIAAGGSLVQIQGLQFTVEQPDALVAEAKAKALQDGRNQAKALADSMQVKLGSLRSVSTSTQIPSVGYGPSGLSLIAPRTGDSGAGTPISIGLFDLVVTANLRYNIK